MYMYMHVCIYLYIHIRMYDDVNGIFLYDMEVRSKMNGMYIYIVFVFVRGYLNFVFLPLACFFFILIIVTKDSLACLEMSS
jgi:hypothetical protein